MIYKTNKDILNVIVNLRKENKNAFSQRIQKRRKEKKTKTTQFYLVNLLVFHCVMNCGYGGWKGRGRYPPQTGVYMSNNNKIKRCKIFVFNLPQQGDVHWKP